MDYNSLTIKELKELAKERNMYGQWSIKSNMKKQDIIDTFVKYDEYLLFKQKEKEEYKKLEDAHRETRNLHILGQCPITQDLLDSLEYPFSFLDGENIDEYPIVVDPIPGQDAEDVGNFPNNIEHYYWIHAGENDEEPWLALCKLSNGVYVYYRGECDYTGFDCQGVMEIYASKDPFILVKFAMTSEDYDKYVNETNI
jgi:hypothetical protein